MTLLITGAAGSVGQEVLRALRQRPDVVATDLDTMDVTRPEQVWQVVRDTQPRQILHLAGAKHAPEGETDPETTARVNIAGTANVLRAASAVGAHVVTASTCKACDPETAYGASKLIAERLTLNAGGVVVRFFNVPEAGGNVFRLWETVPADEPLPVTDAWRYFIRMADAVTLAIAALTMSTGRYTIDPGPARHMADVAAELYPGRAQTLVPLRRGDRWAEPLHADCEHADVYASGLMRISGPYDPPQPQQDEPDRDREETWEQMRPYHHRATA